MALACCVVTADGWTGCVCVVLQVQPYGVGASQRSASDGLDEGRAWSCHVSP